MPALSHLSNVAGLFAENHAWIHARRIIYMVTSHGYYGYLVDLVCFHMQCC